MTKRNFRLLAAALILVLVVLVAPVAANKYVVTSSSSTPVAGADVTISAQLSQDDGTAITTAGKVVTWSRTGTGGTFLAATSTTDASGIATVTFTTGTVAGTAYTVTGTDTDSFTGTSAAITTVAGPATQIAKNAGDAQSATVSTTVATPPSVIVRDANNNPVSGVSITFTVATGGGSATGSPATTSTNGIATVGSWTLGTTAGANTLTVTPTSGSLTGSPLTFTATGTAAAAAAPTISGISQVSGYNSGPVSNVIITGTGFSTSGASVVLSKSGETSITGTISSATATQLTCTFPITGTTAGSWNVVVTNADGQSATLSSGFTVLSSSSAVTLAAITPSSALTNTTVSITSLSGTNFASSATMYLKRTSYNNIPGTISTLSSTAITGSFDLTDQVPGDYQVCVANPSTDAVCGLTFTITSDTTQYGSIYFETNPAGASVFINATRMGTTDFTLGNLTPGSYLFRVQKSSYLDYTGLVTVTAGNTTSFYRKLISEYPDTTASTTIPATTVKTVQTTKKSTVKAPTPWPTATATPASPVDTLLVIGAAGLGIAVLRKQ